MLRFGERCFMVGMLQKTQVALWLQGDQQSYSDYEFGQVGGEAFPDVWLMPNR